MSLDPHLETLAQGVLAIPDEEDHVCVETGLMKEFVRSWMDYQAFSGRQARHVQQLREENKRLRSELGTM